MQYIILANSKEKKGEKIALIDRKVHKDHWWTEDINKAVVFTSKERAEIQCSKMKFNKPKVYEYNAGKTRLGQVAVGVPGKSWFSRALDRKMSEWHDDDWDEGRGDHD